MPIRVCSPIFHGSRSLSEDFALEFLCMSCNTWCIHDVGHSHLSSFSIAVESDLLTNCKFIKGKRFRHFCFLLRLLL